MAGRINSTRRTWLAGAAAASMLLLAACGGTGAGSGGSDSPSALPSDSLNPNADLKSQSLVVSNWDAYMPEDLPAKFQAAVGPKVTVTHHATNEEIMGKLTAGGDSGIDVAFVSGQYAQALNEAGRLLPLGQT